MRSVIFCEYYISSLSLLYGGRNFCVHVFCILLLGILFMVFFCFYCMFVRTAIKPAAMNARE